MADMSVASCIRPMSQLLGAPGTITVKRRPQPVYILGVMQENPFTTLTITGVVTTASPRSLMFLPEGERSKDSAWVWSESPLQLADVQGQQLSDLFVFNGRDYEVTMLFDRTVNDNFYKALGVRVGQ